MNPKIPVFQLLFIMIFCLSCNETIIEANFSPPGQSQTSLLKSAAIGVTYYVDKSGDDKNKGTDQAPFLTITRASQVAKPGDVVIVGNGTYSTTSKIMNMISCKGSEGNYITFKSQSRHGAVMEGNNVSSYCFSLVYGASYLKFVDFEIRNFLRFGFDINHPGYISSNIKIEGCRIWNIGRIIDTGNNGRCGIFIGQKNHHVTIDKNLIYNIGRIGPDNFFMNKDHAIYIADPDPDIPENASHHNVITSNLILNISGCHLTMGSNNDLIANNVLAWVMENSRGGNCIIYTGSQGCFNETIVNNIFYQPPRSSPFVIWASSGTAGWSVKSNMVYGGQMWYSKGSSGWASAMKGGNYGKIDCEYDEVNPLFYSAVRGNDLNHDFGLQAASPAINKGVNVGLTTDYKNNSLVGQPDIGAIEYTLYVGVYYNVSKSASATRNNCGAGYTGSTETFTVAANKYSSTVSQDDANAKAIEELNAYKQLYANAYGACTLTAAITYYNARLTTTATKNDCGTGYTGSTETFAVAANNYSSTISQEDANARATEELNAYKQLYANAYGTCTLKQGIIFYNSKLTATVNKNNCGSGYTGSLVTYTVPANKYSSAISQNDAENKASADLNANKQAYANANGICTPNVTYMWWKR